MDTVRLRERSQQTNLASKLRIEYGERLLQVVCVSTRRGAATCERAIAQKDPHPPIASGVAADPTNEIRGPVCDVEEKEDRADRDHGCDSREGRRSGAICGFLECHVRP